MRKTEDHILVPQAESFGTIAVIRSLGEHGYKVHASSYERAALGLKSNFAHASHVSPRYEDAGYYAWLVDLIHKHKIKAIIPSEGFMLAIKSQFTELTRLLPITSDPDIVYGCLSKSYVFKAFLNATDERLKQHIPNTLIIEDEDQIDWSLLNTWQLPLYVKGDGFDGKGHSSSLVRRVETIAEAKQVIESARSQYHKTLVQNHITGAKATVNLLYQEGYLLAESMALASHENPHLGGLTSLRKSWWQQEMYEDAINRLHFLNWNGPAMVEYKWDASTESFTFIELNSRYWAALNLDILAGLHFPTIHLDYFLHQKKSLEVQRLTHKITVRNALPADFGYWISKIKDDNVPLVSKIKSTIGFAVLPFHPGIKADLFYPGDRKLYFLNFWSFCKDLLLAIKRRLGLIHRSHGEG